MPAPAEFTLTILRRRNEETGLVSTVFRFATVREFRSFRYQIQVEDAFDPELRRIAFRIFGVQAPANLMPGAGAAYREIIYPGLQGEYLVSYAGAKKSGEFRFRVDDEQIAIVEAPKEDGIRIEIEKGIENIRQ